MFRQVWAAVLYLYGLLFNSMTQCPEHSQLTALEVGKEVRRTGEGESQQWTRKVVGGQLKMTSIRVGKGGEEGGVETATTTSTSWP